MSKRSGQGSGAHFCKSIPSSKASSVLGRSGGLLLLMGALGFWTACTNDQQSADSSVTGGTSAGGADSTGGASSEASQPLPDDQFELVFRDDFDSFDSTRWKAMSHSWTGNLALFSKESVSVQDGVLSVSVLAAPSGTQDDSGNAKAYLGAEVRSIDTVTWGRVKAKIRFASGGGVISSLVSIYTPWPADDWAELDLELLGQTPDKLQSNIWYFPGASQGAAPTTSVSPLQTPIVHPLGFDASAEFHEYTLEFTPQGSFFLVDGRVVRQDHKLSSELGLAQNVLLTIWVSGEAAWAGATGGTTIGAHADYDWVEIERYLGAPSSL